MNMCYKLTNILFFFLFLKVIASYEGEYVGFTFNGFNGADLIVDGRASIASNGLLQLTNDAQQASHVFYPQPLHFKSAVGKVLSFSSTFVFAIVSNDSDTSGHGLVFVISSTTNLDRGFPAQYLGLFNPRTNGNFTNHIVAVELDTIQDLEFDDINDNHVGIDVNSLHSITSHTAGYYASDGGLFQNLSLVSCQALMHTMSPIQMPKPKQPLILSTLNLSDLMLDPMYVVFSLSTGSSVSSIQSILGKAESLDYTALPPLPYFNLPPLPQCKNQRNSKILKTWLPLVSCSFVLLVVAAITFAVRRRIKYAELLEDWEKEYGPHRFSYKDLYRATSGFKDKQLLGFGGFGRVYRGVLPISNIEVAVKRVSRDSRQGMKEFVAEIVSIGQLRHRNIVRLLGYCRRKGELLLVYEFMPNCSLDKFLHDPTRRTLDWAQRFRILKGVASGLVYLHEEWEQVVIHRDIKASNVLLDGDMDRKLVGETSLSEVEMVLKLGLLCCHPMPESRPSMRQVMQILDEDAVLPKLSPAYMSFTILSTIQNEDCGDYSVLLPSSVATVTLSSFSEGR